jgi:hypothetical protein
MQVVGSQHYALCIIYNLCFGFSASDKMKESKVWIAEHAISNVAAGVPRDLNFPDYPNRGILPALLFARPSSDRRDRGFACQFPEAEGSIQLTKATATPIGANALTFIKKVARSKRRTSDGPYSSVKPVSGGTACRRG